MSLITDEQILKRAPFSYEDQDKVIGGTFYNALIEELCFHYDHNELYRSFCKNKNFDPHIFNGELADIPPVSVSVFKELGKELSSVDPKNIRLTLQSSATSGIPSSVPIDAITAKRQAKAMIKVVGDFIGNDRKPFLVMDVDPTTGFKNLLGARYAAVSGYLNFASKVGYFLKVNEQNLYYFDLQGIQNFIKDLKEPVVVFGFTYILYSEVVKPLTEQNISFNLPKGSKVIHIGGWKKLEHEKVQKDHFNQLTSQLFGLEPQDIIDIYGFTEQMGLNYPDCPCGMKHLSLYSDVIVRDVITKEPLPAGKEGLLEFISPIPHSYPGNIVLTDDLGILIDGECPCGRKGKRYNVIGRLKKAEIRGCGDILSAKLKFNTASDQKQAFDGKSAFKYFYIDQNLENFAQDLSSDQMIYQLSDKLLSNLSWLRAQPIDALIGLIAKVAQKWNGASTSSMQNSLSETQDQGLRFLVSWCNPAHLIKIANDGLRENRKFADQFIPLNSSSIKSMRAISKGLVCHWLAGNVQVLGMFVLIQSLLSKNVNLLRVSSRDNGAFKNLLLGFKDQSFTTKGGHTILGNDLLKTIALVYYDHHDQKTAKIMSELADVRIAWGGNEAVSTVASLPSKFDCTDLIMGPKLSFSVIANETLSDERKVKKLARKVAVDASVFDQTGCASTHNIFVEKGGLVSPQGFAQLLAEAMDKLSHQMPKGKMTPEEFAAVHSARGIFDFKGQVYGDQDSVWTVLYNEKLELNKPVYSRVVFVHPVEKLEQVLDFIDPNIQTIGLAAEGLKALDFATKAGEKGANRFPACGRMLNFESPWDGMFIMDRLVKWITLGGPIV